MLLVVRRSEAEQSKAKRVLHIQPLGGGLRAIVPAPRGTHAEGDPAMGDLVVPVLVLDEEAVETAGEAARAGEVGEIGFILSPLKAVFGRMGSDGIVKTERGVGGSVLSEEKTGNAGVLPGLSLSGDSERGGGSGKLTRVLSALMYPDEGELIGDCREGD